MRLTSRQQSGTDCRFVIQTARWRSQLTKASQPNQTSLKTCPCGERGIGREIVPAEVVELGLPSTADEWLDTRGRELDLECVPKRKDC